MRRSSERNLGGASLFNVVFPTFFMPYLTMWSVWWVTLIAFAAEIYCIKRLLPELSGRWVIAAMVGANLLSSALGFLMVFLLSWDIDSLLGPFTLLAWPSAYALSVLVESVVMLAVFRAHPRRAIIVAVAAGNAVSYAILGGLAVAHA
jgi:hypothetical protein